MKIVAFILVVIVIAFILGLVGFTYPRVVRDEPLHHPLRVVKIEGTNIVLESGRLIALEGMTAADITNKLQQSDFHVDVEPGHGGSVAIWARQTGWICGTPWAQPIRIPLVPVTVHKNRRKLIAVGSYIRESGQPDGTANRSQPIRAETNSTSSAAGSRR